jgi:hypothetical protein
VDADEISMIGTEKAKKRRRKRQFLHQLLLALILIILAAALFPFSNVTSDTAVDPFDPHGLFLPQETQQDYSCLTEQCIAHFAAAIARPYPSRIDKSTWCLPAPTSESQRPFAGILLTKVPKGASSTSAGVAIRIGVRNGCGSIQWSHRLASEFREQTFDRPRSFLFTTVRDPAARAVSTLFFHIFSRQSVKATDELMIRLLKTTNHTHQGAVSTGQGGFQLRYTSLSKIPEYSAWTSDSPETVLNPFAVVTNVREVVNAYDIILVPERMDESLTAMALLLGIDVGDVLVTSSKVAGSRFHLMHPNKTTFRCIKTAKSTVSGTLKQFLQSAEWRAMNFGDYLLHAAASQSLDLTIKHVIGQRRFEKALARYRYLQELEAEKCAPSVQFPCSDTGEPQMAIARKNCYLFYYDFGCGYPCIDEMIANADSSPRTEKYGHASQVEYRLE